MFASVRTMAACAVAAAGLALATVPADAFTTSKGYHVMPTPAYAAKLAQRGLTPAGPVNYYGGSVFTAPKLVSVMWGSTVNPTTVAAIPASRARS